MSERKWWQRIGPGLITACVVIGPGSILTSSKVGASNGFGMIWVVVLAVVFMMVYTALGAKLGVVANASTGTLVSQRAGRWLAVLIGLGVFFISAAFQFGNNLGVHSAFKEYEAELTWIPYLRLEYLVILFNALSILFLFAFKNLYRAVERLMMLFVAVMLLSFAINLVFARPDPREFVVGFVPPVWELFQGSNKGSLLDLSVLGLVGTTFVITAAYYQSYLVRQKGWGKAEMQDGLNDARVGAVIMALITIMLMSTAAAVLRGKSLQNVGDVAAGLRPAFGAWGHTLFCLGLFSAAYSSFLVNSMIGGFILSDGLGWGSKPTDLAPRLLTTVVLLTGMGVALYVIIGGWSPVPAIVAAQAVTVVAAPLVAGAILWLTNLRDVMGSNRNGIGTNILAGIGFVLLLAMAWYTAAVKIPEGVEKMRARPASEHRQQEAQEATKENATPAFNLAALTLPLLVPPASTPAEKPNILLIVADDMGYSDLGCYGSAISTPHLDGLAREGLRFTQFYNAARCCPTRAALLTGLYPHQAGVGHMLENWKPPSYSNGLSKTCVTAAQLLKTAGYRNYHVGKWHVGGLGRRDPRNHPLNRGFDRAYGSAGGGNYFALQPLYLDREFIKPGKDFYATDAFSDWAVKFLEEHARAHQDQPFFLHLCYTAPHFPLHAKPADIARYQGKYRAGWDVFRQRRHQAQKKLGIVDPAWQLSPRDPVAKPWAEVPEAERKEWDLRMAVHAAMIDCMDQGIGRVLNTLRRTGQKNTVILFFSDNGCSAEALDTWPNPRRGHKPGSITGTRESHRCLEVGWANMSNTPFREHKMWVHEGGIATPLIVHWPKGIASQGGITHEVGHVIDLVPTFLDLANLPYPKSLGEHKLPPLEGKSLVPVLRGKSLGSRTLAWEHDGNRAIRVGDWKLVARYQGPWELYNLKADRTETNDLAKEQPAKVREVAAQWQAWADRVGVVPWAELPGSKYKPTPRYRKKSEPVAP
jgi:NRAMP (natural resistance-associated macrophage protein)-like metal ion transporter